MKIIGNGFVFKFLPTLLVSDGFGSVFGTSDGLAATVGVGNGGGGVTWTTRSGTFGITSSRAYTSTLSGGIATVNLSMTDVYLSCKLYRNTNQVGVIVRWTDASNYIRAVHDGTNVIIVKRIAGADTTVSTTAAAYSAGAPIAVDISGTSFGIYYNGALVTTATISDSALQSGTSVGLYTSHTSNQMDDFYATK